jgi:hypothetical protein
MPARIHSDDIPVGASPMIISETSTHIVIAVELDKVTLARHRRFLENLLAVAKATDG